MPDLTVLYAAAAGRTAGAARAKRDKNATRESTGRKLTISHAAPRTEAKHTKSRTRTSNTALKHQLDEKLGSAAPRPTADRLSFLFDRDFFAVECECKRCLWHD